MYNLMAKLMDNLGFRDVLDLIGSLGFFGIAVFFIEKLISKQFDQKLSSYKSQLDAKMELHKAEIDNRAREFQLELDQKMEKYRVELSLEGYKSTKTYDKQLEVIITTYRLLHEVNKEMHDLTALMHLTNPDKVEEEEGNRITRAATAHDELAEFFRPNKIFFTSNIANKLEKALQHTYTAFDEYTTGKSAQEGDLIKTARNTVRKELAPLIDEIHSEFQKLIGLDFDLQ